MPNPTDSIPVNLLHPGDFNSDILVSLAIQQLVSGDGDAAAIAEDIDFIITDECETQPPKSAAWHDYLWDSLGKTAMVVPHFHDSQDLLVALLQELQSLPRHTVLQKIGDQVLHKELWVLTPENKYDGLEQRLWDICQGPLAAEWVEHNKDVASLYINFSSFLARLFAGQVVETSRSSALIQPSPFASRDPLTCAVESHEPWVSAAAQWILYAGDALYEMCQKETTPDIGEQKWTRALWGEWKSNFKAVAETARFSSKATAFAATALQKMTQAEKRGVTTNVLPKFGLTPTKN